MKALFFIEIPAAAHSAELSYSWYKKELPAESEGFNTLTDIKNLSLNCEVILVLPGFNVIQKQITSKISNRKKLELAIGYELEEELSEEIENLFFAYQPAKEKHSLDVAILNKAWFEQWLEIFKQHEILLSAVITDAMLLATVPQDYLLIQKNSYCLLKTLTGHYLIDTENLSYFLAKLKESLPEELALIADKQATQALPKLPVILKPVPIQAGLLKLLTEHYAPGVGINLLQGSYKPKLKNDWQKIKWVSIALFGLFFSATVFQGYQHWQLSRQEAKLDQQRLKIFQDTLPAVKKIVNPLVQMKNELEKLTQSQQQQGQFISLLAKVSLALREMIAQEKLHLIGMEFDNNVLLLKLNANSLALIEQSKQSLAAQQLQVEIVSSDKAENQVNASFKLSGNVQ